MKRIISILMSITVILSMMPALAFATDDSIGSSASAEATDVKTPAEPIDVSNNGESDKAIDESTVASIADGDNVKCYKTLTKAISEASNVEATDSNQNLRTITLQKDVEEDITVSKNAIFLDLNGKTLTNKSNDTITINKGAKLTVVGEGTVDNVTHGKAAVYNSGEADLLGGTYTRSKENGQNATTSGGNSYYNILNHGGMHIGDAVTVSQTGKFSSLIDNGYYNYDSNIPRSGYVQGVNFEKPELTIDGATFSGGLNTIKNDDGGILTINDGKFSNYSQNVVQNHNVAEINNGTFASDGTQDANVYNCGCGKHDAGQLTINGGTFTGGKVAIQDVSKKTDAPDAFVKVKAGHFSNSNIDVLDYIDSDSNITVSLTNSVTLSKPVTIPQGSKVYLDLGGNKVSRSGGVLFDVYGDLHIQNGEIEMSGLTDKPGSAIWLNKIAKLTVAPDATVATDESSSNFAVGFWSDCTTATLTLGGKVVGANGITINGNIKESGNKIEVKDGACVDVSGTGLYLAGVGETTLSNADVKGDTAVEIRAGKMTINDGNYTATAEKFSCDPNGNGTTTDGAAVAIAQHTTKKDISVTINGGTFKGIKALNESNPQNNDPAPQVALSINGGSFTGEVTTVDCSKFINAGSFSVNPDKNYIADGKNVYLKNDKNYYVAAKAPANSTGMNAWAKGEDGIYTETYVAPAPTPEPEKNPITNSGSASAGDAATKVDASDNTNTTDGKTETKIDSELGGKIVDNAVENKSTEVKVDAVTDKGDSTESNVVLPAATVKDLADKTQASVTINTDNANVSLDKKAVDAVAEKAGTTGDVKLVVQTKEVKDNKVVIELKIETANGEVHDFKGGIATVTVPVHKDMKDKELVAVYIDENGKYTILDGKKNADGTFTFTTGHFSTYAVMTKADADAAVEAQKIENAEVSGIVAKTYTGKEITQDVVVTLGEKTLTAGTDYEVTYENNVKVGLASVKIAGKGKYEGEITKTFKINPKSVALTSVKAQKKALKATWKKSANKVTGYQVRYSTSKTFKSSKTASVKYTKKVNSKVVKNLKSNKRYYVKVRTYTKTVDGTYYSVWSKVKSVKVK